MLAALLASGIYFIVADVLKLPAIKASKAVLNVRRHDKKKTKTIETYIWRISVKLSG